MIVISEVRPKPIRRVACPAFRQSQSIQQRFWTATVALITALTMLIPVSLPVATRVPAPVEPVAATSTVSISITVTDDPDFAVRLHTGVAHYFDVSAVQRDYGARLWDDTNSVIKAPSIRGILTIAATVVSTIVGKIPGIGTAISMAIQTVNAAMWAGMDLMTGKDPAQVALEFTKAVAIAAITTFALPALGSAIGGIGQTATEGIKEGVKATIEATKTAGQLVADAAKTVTTSFIGNAMTGLVNNVNLQDGHLGFDADGFREGLVGKGALASYAGAAAGSMAGGALTNAFGQDSGFLKGVTSLASYGATTAAKFGTMLAMNAAGDRGHSSFADLAKNSFDDMGGVSINVADIGSLIGAIRDTAVRGSADYVPADNEWSSNIVEGLKGTGLVLNFNSQGMTGHFGQDGFNAMGALADINNGLAMMSMAQRQAAAYGGGDSTKYQNMYGMYANAYKYGNYAAIDTMNRLDSGIDSLQVGLEGSGQENSGAEGFTKHKAGGGRQIYLGSLDSIAQGATVFSHESMRSGYKAGETRADGSSVSQNYMDAETKSAVKAHITMATQMAAAYGDSGLTERQRIEVYANKIAQQTGNTKLLDQLVDSYDSSDAFWRQTANGGLVADGDGWLRDVNGNKVKDKNGNFIGADGMETGLLNILFAGDKNRGYGDFTAEQKKQAQQLMMDSGFSHAVEAGKADTPENWIWTANDGKVIKPNDIAWRFDRTVSDSVFKSLYAQEIAKKISGTWNPLDGAAHPGADNWSAWQRLDNLPEVQAAVAARLNPNYDPNVKLSPKSDDLSKAKEVQNYLTNDRITGSDAAWEQFKQANNWSMSEYHCSEIVIRDLLNAGYNPGKYVLGGPYATDIPTAVQGYKDAGIARDLPVLGTTGLIYYDYGDGYQHVQRYEYTKSGFTVWETDGTQVPTAVPNKPVSVDGIKHQTNGNYNWKNYIVVPTDWVKK